MNNETYLNTEKRSHCTGCEACVQSCSQNAISFHFDDELFGYPVIDKEKCVNCGKCYECCPVGRQELLNTSTQYCFGGYSTDADVLQKSTSGGAFTEIVKGWCGDNCVVFGAVQNSELQVEHKYITDIAELDIMRKSKYSQSRIGTAYCDCRRFLAEGKKVIFSGTPCQIAGLKAYLRNKDYPNLLTIDVICEGVPSPKFIRSFVSYLEEKNKSKKISLDYSDKDNDRWDFNVMSALFQNGKTVKIDRWVNPFFDFWMQHIMSRPSCYECMYTSTNRAADITLGDLWGVHVICPELYNDNRGCSLILCNTEKGLDAFTSAQMIKRKLELEAVLKFCSRMRNPVQYNERREEFLSDLDVMPFRTIKKKWYKGSSLKFLFSKYVYGSNRQKVNKYLRKQKRDNKERG